MNIPGFVAECSLYPSTTSYVTAHTPQGGGAVVPAQQLGTIARRVIVIIVGPGAV